MQPFQLQGELGRAANLRLIVHSKVTGIRICLLQNIAREIRRPARQADVAEHPAPALLSESKMQIIHFGIPGEYEVKSHTWSFKIGVTKDGVQFFTFYLKCSGEHLLKCTRWTCRADVAAFLFYFIFMRAMISSSMLRAISVRSLFC